MNPGSRTCGGVALASLALLLAASTTRAANLDAALLKAAPKILEYLKSENYQNVGVLPFQVQKGTRKASYDAAPLAANLPGRVENALIMSQGDDEKTAVRIIRDAAGVAARAKAGRYTTDDDAFKKLFRLRYPLAWGTRKVRADAFLTGVVLNTGDRAKTKIKWLLLTPESRSGGTLKPLDLKKVDVVRTDRSLLRDLGYTFALSRSVLKRDVSAEDRDDYAIDQVDQREQGKTRPGSGQSNEVTPTNIEGMAFELRYNGVTQKLRPISQTTRGSKSPQYEADPVEPDTEVTMVLTRLLDEDKRLGVVVRVNGRSTWKEEEEEPIKCVKWLYDLSAKGKPDVFRGFYDDATGKNVRKFRVASAEESAAKASDLGDRAGWIDIDVFASRESEVDVSPSKTDEDEVKVSTRGLARPKKRPRTLGEAQIQLRKANNVKVKKNGLSRGRGGLILAEVEPSDEVQLDKAELPNPIHLGGISIRYYDKGSKGSEE
jgi:hypothetical protein